MARSGGARTLYIDDAVWARIQELVRRGYARNASQLVNRLLAEALDRLDASHGLVGLSYEELKLRHVVLSSKVSSLENRLKRSYGAEYRALLSLAENLGIDFGTFGNLDVVAPKLISQWRGNPTLLHLFLTLLEQARTKREIERKLGEFRKRLYRVNTTHST